jgi:hypothetical protein
VHGSREREVDKELEVQLGGVQIFCGGLKLREFAQLGELTQGM